MATILRRSWPPGRRYGLPALSALCARKTSTHQDVLDTLPKMEGRFTPTKCLALLGEVTSRARKEEQVPELLQSTAFTTLVQKVENRLYGFSASEVYVLVLCLSRTVRAPMGEKSVEKILKLALEQLEEDLEDLDVEQLAQLTQLRHVGISDSKEVEVSEFWSALMKQLRSRMKEMKIKTICLIVEGLSTWPRGDVCPELLKDLAVLIESRLDDFSMTHLARLGRSIATLGAAEELVFKIAGRLEPWTLAPRQLCETFELLAILKVPQEMMLPLLPRCMEVASNLQPSWSLRVLRSMACGSLFPPELALLLLMQVVKMPRTSFTDAEDRALHQVSLSLLHDPAAKPVFTQLDDDLWEILYRPEEAVLEDVQSLSDLRALEAANKVEDVASISYGQVIQRFYWCPMMIKFTDGRCLVVDLERQDEVLFERLKEKHLQLWDLPLVKLPRPAANVGDLLKELPC